MGSLLMVRHGPGRTVSGAGAEELSPAGERQAHLLGEGWAREGGRLDRVFCGPRERQRRSAEEAVRAFLRLGGRCPPVWQIDDLDEMRVEPLLGEHLARLCQQHPVLLSLSAEVLAASAPEERARHAARLSDAVLRLWSRDQLAAPGVEPWRGFVERVERALDLMLTGAPRGARLVCFTSSGVIGVAAQRALELGADRALDLALQLRHAATSEFLYSWRQPRRLSLRTFNEAAHLGGEPALLAQG
jgi:broad specificity phosphatase PhoE